MCVTSEVEDDLLEVSEEVRVVHPAVGPACEDAVVALERRRVVLPVLPPRQNHAAILTNQPINQPTRRKRLTVRRTVQTDIMQTHTYIHTSYTALHTLLLPTTTTITTATMP